MVILDWDDCMYIYIYTIIKVIYIYIYICVYKVFKYVRIVIDGNLTKPYHTQPSGSQKKLGKRIRHLGPTTAVPVCRKRCQD